MELKDAIGLISDQDFYQQTNAVWADLGCGTGLFSYSLANLLQQGSVIHAIDKSNTKLIKHNNPRNILIKQKQLDFIADDLNLSDLDGILMANSLHFVKNKTSLIHKLSRSLKDDSGFLIVEYDTDSANPWVPFPVSYHSLDKLFKDAGYSQVRKIHERPSAFGRSLIYAAIVTR